MRTKCTPIPLPIDERAAQRFWSHVQKSDGCWIWIGTREKRGYGKFKYQGHMHRASRFVWTMVHGAIPDELHVLHRCDNPVCVNPEHLFLGTHHDNMSDMAQKGRSAKGASYNVGGNNGRAKLTVEEVQEIKRLVAIGVSQKQVALQFGVAKSTVSEISSGVKWKAAA